MDGVNIIAALCSTGELVYTVNVGKTNSNTYGLFLTKLCEHLDHEDPLWREDTVLVMDNAGYNRGKPVNHLLETLKLPVLYLGPYHFRMAPIEMMFNFINNNDLNPLRSTLTSR